MSANGRLPLGSFVLMSGLIADLLSRSLFFRNERFQDRTSAWNCKK
jgi:hypothetical protein